MIKEDKRVTQNDQIVDLINQLGGRANLDRITRAAIKGVAKDWKAKDKPASISRIVRHTDGRIFPIEGLPGCYETQQYREKLIKKNGTITLKELIDKTLEKCTPSEARDVFHIIEKLRDNWNETDKQLLIILEQYSLGRLEKKDINISINLAISQSGTAISNVENLNLIDNETTEKLRLLGIWNSNC